LSINGTKNNAKARRGEKKLESFPPSQNNASPQAIQLRPLFTNLAFVDVGVERKVIVITE
jgi:hypothetical protein